MAGYSFTLKMGPNLMQQQPWPEEEERAHIGSVMIFCPSRPLVSSRNGLQIASDQGKVGKDREEEGGKDLQTVFSINQAQVMISNPGFLCKAG